MKKDYIEPIASLTLICFVIAAALAATNSLTEPVIAVAAAERAATMRQEILPEATGFEPIPLEGMPGSVREAYRSTNHVGYVFILCVSGYGSDIEIICGINEAGDIIAASVLRHAETKGIGTKIEAPSFSDQFIGMDQTMSGVSAITGATISSRAYINALADAFVAFGLVACAP
jgi:electron transport complex protein RnfG